MAKKLILLFGICFINYTAIRGQSDSLTQWRKLTGWHIGVGYTRNNYNSFTIDVGRYKTYKPVGRWVFCAFGFPPLIHRGAGFDYIYKGTTQGYALRLYAQMDVAQVLSYRIDFLNCFENGAYSPKIRPGFGITLNGLCDIQYNYTASFHNRDVLKQRHGVTLRVNFNPYLYRRLNPGPPPNANW